MRLITDRAWGIATLIGEARGEPYLGKLGVAEVLRNRTLRHYSSKGSVASTVLMANQFSCWNTDDPNRLVMALIDDTDPSVSACAKAWDEAAAGSNTVLGAVHYLNPRTVPRIPSWVAACREVAIIGAHHFYVPASWVTP